MYVYFQMYLFLMYTDTNKYINLFKIFPESIISIYCYIFFLLVTDSKSWTDVKMVKRCKNVDIREVLSSKTVLKHLQRKNIKLDKHENG